MHRKFPWIYSQPGIYRLVILRPNLPPKYYVGQTVNFRGRSKIHFKSLREGSHKNFALQADFVKYGREAFSFEILLVCPKDKQILDFYEQLLLDSYKIGDLYNICLESVGSRTGVKARPETCLLIRKNTKGSHGPISKEGSEAIRRSNQTRVTSVETRRKRSISLTGNQNSKGVTLSPKRKKEIGDFFRGKKKSSEEIARRQATRRKNAEKRGYWTPPESAKRGGDKLRGRKETQEHKANISLGLLRFNCNN